MSRVIRPGALAELIRCALSLLVTLAALLFMLRRMPKRSGWRRQKYKPAGHAD